MKTIGVRVSELEQKRLMELANKRGATLSDTVREILNNSFLEAASSAKEKKEHEQTREQMRADLKLMAESVDKFSAQCVQYLKAIYGQVAPKQAATQNTNGGKK